MFVFPIGVVTVTDFALRVAFAAMMQLACTVVAVGTGPVIVQVTPPFPPVMVTAVAPVRRVPVRVTGTVVLRVPDVGVIEVSVGPITVNVTALLVPPGVVTVTFLAVVAAEAVIVNVAVICVALTTVTLLTVKPVPDTVTAVAPVKLVPVRVTATAEPRTPVLGAIDVSVGAFVAPPPPVNSTAPGSK